MVRFVFTVEDLARTRFAISPMLELEGSLLALRDPSTAAVHVPWLRSLDGRLGGIAIERATALVPPSGYVPDFLTPPPSGPLGDVRDDLAALCATPVEQVVRELRLVVSQHGRSRLVDAWLADPAGELARLADTLEAYWQRALEPVWPRVRAFLEGDLAHRARQLADAGPAALLADLHPAVRWHGDHLDVEVRRHDATIELDGRGLLLLPSAFRWATPSVIDLPPWQPTLIYPARGVGTLWEEAPATPDGLARLLGATRAAVLTGLDAPCSTTELARRLGVSAAGASHHLVALRDAGLVAGRRDGRAVLYVRTATGDAVLRGAGAPAR